MRRRGVLLMAGIVALAAAAPAHAATTYKVSGTADGTGACADGVCTTLRAALAAAKAGDTISLPTPKPATDVYHANSQMPIGSSVTIKGSGAQNVTIEGGGKERVFSVGPNQTVTISGVTLSSGTALGQSDKRGGNVLIGQGASLTLDHVRVTLGTALRGGGIAALGASKLTIQQSLIDRNTAGSAAAGGDGGGLISIGDAKLAGNEVRISDSTIARNTASTAPGISLRDNPDNVAQIDRSTIAYNTAGSNGGSGVYTSDAEKVTIGSSILAGNTGDGTQDNCTPGANIVSTGGNIEDRGDKCGFAAPADKPDTAALIASELTMDGGQTPVLAFSSPRSPGIDFAPACVGADQRDISRPQGKSCDSGAYELDQAPDVTIDDGPSGLVSTPSVQFRFSSQEPGVSFECRLDGPNGTVGTFAACASPQAYPTLADGDYQFLVRAIDDAHTSPAASRTFTVDSTAPAPPVFTAPAEGSAQKSRTITLTGTGELFSTITVKEGATVKGTPLVTQAGTWSLQITNVADGLHTYTAAATDGAGNTGSSATLHVTVDNVAPAAPAITAPPDGSFQNVTTVALQGTAEMGSTVEIFEGSASRGTAVTGSDGKWSRNVIAAEGTHVYTATAADAAGNTSGASAGRTITVDNAAPAAPAVTTPATTPTVQNSAKVDFAGTGEPFATVQVLEGSTVRTTTTVAAGGGWSVSLTGVGDAQHVYTINQRDRAQNVSPGVGRTITVDTHAPDAPVVVLPAENAFVTTATPQLSGTAEAGATITIKESGTVHGTGTATGGNWAITLTTLSEGSHTLSVTATDAATNESPVTNRTIRVDTVKPDAPAFSTPANNAFQNSQTIVFTGTAEPGASVQLFEGATAVGSPATATGGSWTVTLNGVAEGAHTYQARATDAAQNTSADSAGRTVTVDLTAPNTTVFAGPDDPTNVKTVAFTFSSSEAGSTFQCRLDGPGSATGTFGTCPADYGPLGDGRYTFRVRATDRAHNTDGSPATYAFTVDATAPAAPVIESPAAGAAPLSTHDVPLSGTAEAGATVKVFKDGALQGSATATGGHWSLTAHGVADGGYTFTATAMDAAGNTSEAATRHVDVDTGPPDVPAIVAPAEGALINDAGFTVSGSAEPGATVELFEGGVSRGTATAQGGQWAIGLAAVADGSHTYAARATDVAGNVSRDSPSRTVTVDTTAPAADVTGGPDGPTTDSAPAFPFSSPDAASAFDCRLDGPSGPGTYQPCVSPKSFSGLAPGDYTFFLRATDPAGNQTVTTRSFTVTVPQQATPTPTQTPTPAFQQSVVVQPAGGKVLVKRKGTKTFVALDASQGIPLGSEVDTRHGKVRLSSVPSRAGKVQTALFYAGRFVVTQVGGITNLRLSEPLAKCPTARASMAAKKKRKPKSRRLWGDGSGAFRTQGRYSAATVRGTKWLVQDTCAGTLTRVARGVVQVNDRVRHKKLVLRKGKHYTAKPKKRR